MVIEKTGERPWIGFDMNRLHETPYFNIPSNKVLFFFDFDGVLICPTGERLYREEEKPGERAWLEPIAREAGINPDLFSTRYLRHLVHQAVFDLPAAPTVFTEFAKKTEDSYFVLTARSSRHAIGNMFDFLDEQGLKPQETFCLGRSSKGTHMGHMLECFPEHHLVFIDDNLHHVESVAALNSDRIAVYHADWDSQ